MDHFVGKLAVKLLQFLGIFFCSPHKYHKVHSVLLKLFFIQPFIVACLVEAGVSVWTIVLPRGTLPHR